MLYIDKYIYFCNTFIMKCCEGARQSMTQSLTGQATQTAQRENRPLFALFGANIISYIGDYLMILAIPWFVLQTTGSITETGITAFFSTLPTVLAAFFGSALVDRLGYKRT